MSTLQRQTLPAVAVILTLAAALAWAGSDNGRTVGRVPVFAVCIALAFLINWPAYIHAQITRTERYFDLTGAVANIALPLAALALSGERDARSWLLFLLIAVWAGRLGFFLFQRIRAVGHDRRFAELKQSAPRFFVAWSLQALWSSFTLAAALAAITALERRPLDLWAAVGLLVWVIGFAIEATADWQKEAFRRDPANRGRFIQSGLWAWSRHPNYFGEIVLWIGVALIALPVLSGWQWATLVSPLFVAVLLLRISGAPLLEAQADARWGDDAAYQAYKARTPLLIPRRPAD